MSRTDHHRPYRIQAADPLTPLRYRSNYLVGIHSAEPTWELPYRVFVHPPHGYLKTHFHGPQRAAVRAWARDVIAAHRAGDDIPDEPDGRARNSCKWLWF